MLKSPEAFRTISEVAETLDVPPHVLRFWETRFVQVKPVKRGGGRRYYRPEDVRLLRGIRGLLYDDGMTIKGVQKILRERGVRHVIGLGTVPDSEEAARPHAARTEAYMVDDLDAEGFDPEAVDEDDLEALDAFAEEEDVPPPAAGASGADRLVPKSEAEDVSAPAAAPVARDSDVAPAPSRPTTLRELVASLEALRTVMSRDA